MAIFQGVSSGSTMAILGWAGHLVAIWLLGLTLGWLVSKELYSALLPPPEPDMCAAILNSVVDVA